MEIEDPFSHGHKITQAVVVSYFFKMIIFAIFLIFKSIFLSLESKRGTL